MMKNLRSQLGGAVKSVRRVLAQPITLREGNITFGVPPAQALEQAQAHEQLRQRVRRMRRDLYELLERHPDSRQLMRHLDVVEQTLRRNGLAGVEALPVRVIAKALTQMERLVWDWTPVGLAELRSRMAVMVKNPPVRAVAPVSEPDSTDAVTTESIELDLASYQAADVTEVESADLSAFEEMERSWAGSMPEAAAQAVAAAKAANNA